MRNHKNWSWLPLPLCFLFFCIGLVGDVHGQKLLLLEQANVVKPVKLGIGDRLVFKLQGEEDYWYQRTITDILPEGNSLMLDHQLVRLEDIAALKISRKGYVRLVGSALVTFGVSMGVAITAAVLYRDFDYNFPALIGAGAGSFLAGSYLLTPRKIKMGKKFRLRIIEIKFGDTAPPSS